MRFNLEKIDRFKSLRREYHIGWHEHFLWFPKKIDGKIVWLEKVAYSRSRFGLNPLYSIDPRIINIAAQNAATYKKMKKNLFKRSEHE